MKVLLVLPLKYRENNSHVEEDELIAGDVGPGPSLTAGGVGPGTFTNIWRCRTWSLHHQLEM